MKFVDFNFMFEIQESVPLPPKNPKCSSDYECIVDVISIHHLFEEFIDYNPNSYLQPIRRKIVEDQSSIFCDKWESYNCWKMFQATPVTHSFIMFVVEETI